MPYGADSSLDFDPPLAMIQSDLQESVEGGYSSDLEIGHAASVSVGLNVYKLQEEEFGVSDDLNGTAAAAMSPPVPEADMGMDIDEEEVAETALAPSSSAKKRGRPSRSASGTPAKSIATASKTPRSTKSVNAAAGRSTTTPKSAKSSTSALKSARASTGRKRKPEEVAPEGSKESEKEESETEAEPTPAAKRGRTAGRPSRTAGVAASARLAAKAAKKPVRGRPKSTDTKDKKAKGKAGRPRKNVSEANGDVPDGEYEVEAIRDSRIDADTMEHWYQIKWKGYPESDNSWEPKTNLKHALDLVKAFDSKKKKQEIDEAVRKAKNTVAKAKEDNPKAASRGRASKAVKPVKPVTKAVASAGRRGRPARATRGSK